MLEKPETSAEVVLVAIGDGFLAFDVGEALSTAGYFVLGPTVNREAALRLLQHTRPTAALVDFPAPKHRHCVVARQLRALSIPFALVGDAASNAAIREFPQAHLLPAPISDDALLAIVRIMHHPRTRT